MGRPGIGRLTSGIGILHLLATLPLIALVAGGLLTHMARQDPPVRAPAWFGPTFGGIGLVGGILMPVSGFCLLLALGLYTTWLGRTSGSSCGP